MKLLLHVCCAPCLEYQFNILKNENIDFEGYFYNPNIHPDWEYKRRKDTLEGFAEKNSFLVHYSIPSEDILFFNQLSFENMWKEFQSDQRCMNCYQIRLERTAKFAVENGYDAFTSTLLGSIYQNFDLLCKIGNEISEKYNIKFYARDFRDGFRIGQSMAKEQGLYRQKYCGCICSLDQSALKAKILASLRLN